MKTTLSGMAAVVLTASILFACTTALQATIDESYTRSSNARVFINTTAVKPDFEINTGKEVFVSPSVLYNKSQVIKASFEFERSDGFGITYPIDRPNLLNLGFEAKIAVGNEGWLSAIDLGQLYNFSEAGALYTNATFSPEVNAGMYVIPIGPDGSLVSSLIGTRVQDLNPYITGGNFPVHSNPNLKVQKVLVLNMPLKLTPGNVATLNAVKNANPGREVSLLLTTSTIVSFSLDRVHGCNHYLDFLFSNNMCRIRYDGELKPKGESFTLQVPKPGELVLPFGATSWLDVWETSGDTPAVKVDLSLCGFRYDFGPNGLVGITITDLPVHSRKFYTLRTRVD